MYFFIYFLTTRAISFNEIFLLKISRIYTEPERSVLSNRHLCNVQTSTLSLLFICPFICLSIYPTLINTVVVVAYNNVHYCQWFKSGPILKRFVRSINLEVVKSSLFSDEFIIFLIVCVCV